MVFTLGLTQDAVIQFAGSEDGMTTIPASGLHTTSDDLAAVVEFQKGYQAATASGHALDERIRGDSEAAAGSDYATITTLALRQTFGALQFGGTKDKPYIFLKEISSNSDIQTVDVIFPAFPIFLVPQPDVGKVSSGSPL